MASGTPNHSFTAGLRRHGLVKLSPGSGLASFVERELAFSGTPARNKDDAADDIRSRPFGIKQDRERELLTCTGGTASRRLPLQEHFTIERVWGSSTPCRGKDKMRTYLAIAAAAVMITGAAMAQPANRDANTPAVNTPNTPPNPGAPVAGSNSFTEGQAKSRIESNGFSNVSELRKDDQGVWRGKAMKDGKSVTVSLDFQGNVTAQ
jgi:hypothetical protein